MIKNKNAIFKDLIDIINQALITFDITGYNIQQLFQPLKQTPTVPTIFMQILNQKNNGWQFSNDLMIKNEYKHKEQYIHEFDLKLDVLRRRTQQDTICTLNGSDVIERIKAYLLSKKGVQFVRSKGYNIYNPIQLNNVELVDDSENFEFMPSLTITFVINQSWNSSQSTISSFEYNIKKI